MTSGIIAIAAALAISVSTMFPALGQGKTASAAMEAIAASRKLQARSVRR